MKITKYLISGSSVASSIITSAWKYVAISRTGKYQLAIGDNYTYTSTTYGITWNRNTIIGAANWYTCSVNATGKYMVAFSNKGIIYSKNYGITFRSIPLSYLVNAAKASATGQYITVASPGGVIYTSNTFGASYATYSSNITAGMNYIQVAVSTSGQYQTLIPQAGYLLTSFNYGQTWSTRISSTGWVDLITSNDMRYQIARTSGMYTYISSDYGISWNEITVTQNMGYLYVSGDGSAITPLLSSYLTASPTSNAKTGFFPCFIGIGGFVFDQSYNPITLSDQTNLAVYDVTGSVQLKIPAGLLNSKLGSFNYEANVFPVDAVDISLNDLRTYVDSSANVVSVGKLLNVYTEFESYVNRYFDFARGGFHTIYNDDDLEALNAELDVMTGQDMINVIQNTEAYGGINIANINKLLRYAVDTNNTGNREATTGVNNGFVPGDLIYCEGGVNLQLKLNVQKTGTGIDLAGIQNVLGVVNEGAGVILASSEDHHVIYKNVTASLLLIVS